MLCSVGFEGDSTDSYVATKCIDISILPVYAMGMPSRHGSVHVATTTRRYQGKIYRTHLLRRTYRDGAQVKHQTLGNLSHLPDTVIELVRRSLRGEVFVPAHDALEIVRSLPHGHVAATLGTLRQLELDRLLQTRNSRERELVVAMVVARLLDPGSKLATARGLEETSSLGEVLGLGPVDVEELYGALDWLVKRQDKVETALAKRHLREGSLVLYDATSVYFEGRSCPLAHHGYSREHRADRLQIVVGLLTDPEGRPIAVEVFDGATADPTTLGSQVKKLQERFALARVVVVGDRGMLTEARIREDLEPRELLWISSLRAPAIKKLAEGGTLQLGLFDQRDLAEIADPGYPGERLIVCRNPLLRAERTRKRQELLEATEHELDAIVAATQRKQRPLRGKEKIGERLGRVLGRFKMSKHFRTEITETSLRYERNTALIEAEAALDGFYILRTNVPVEQMGPSDVVQAYKNLSRAERAFRSLKSVDLKIRPIYHHLPERVRAHVFLCMLAYYVEWHMRQRLAPLLFDDEDPEAGRARRPSVVAPAQRSREADAKARTQHNQEGLPVHSFRGLLKTLATLCRNRVAVKVSGGPTFEQYTLATPLQQRAFDLLDVSPRM